MTTDAIESLACSAAANTPSEVWDLILSQLQSERSYPTLRAVATTSRFFAEVSKRHLFCNLTVYSQHIGRNLDAFVAFLEASPKTAIHIQTLTLDTVPPDPTQQRTDEGWLDINKLAHMVSKLPHLQSLVLQEQLLDSSSDEPISSPRYSLTSLHIDLNSAYDPLSGVCMPSAVFRLLSLFSTVGTLSLESLLTSACDCVEFDDFSMEAYLTPSQDAIRQILDHHPPSVPSTQKLDLTLLYECYSTAFILAFLSRIPTFVQNLSNIAILISNVVLCREYAQFVRSAAPTLRSCEIRVDALYLHELYKYEDPNHFEPLIKCLSPATSLTTLKLYSRTVVESDVADRGMSVSRLILSILDNASVANLQHLSLEYHLWWRFFKEDLEVIAQFTKQFFAEKMEWGKLRRVLRRCTSLETLQFEIGVRNVDGDFEVDVGPEEYDLIHGTVQETIERELAEWKKQDRLRFHLLLALNPRE